MLRPLIIPAIVVSLIGGACTVGSSKPAPTAAPTEAPPTVAATATKPATTATPARSGRKGSSLFSSVFSNALSSSSGPNASSGLGEGDPALKRFLPATGDFPSGYTPLGEFTVRAPDGISEAGGMDMAATMAMSGDVSDPSDLSHVGMMMAMVIHPDDLTSLGQAFDEFRNLSQEDLEDALASGAGDTPFTFTDARVLDVSGLGEGAAGIQMTMDLGELGALFGARGSGAPSAMTVRMYMFGRGEYVGATMRMSFSDTIPDDGDDLRLAHAVDDKLRSAQ
jgi:hypothetical protein